MGLASPAAALLLRAAGGGQACPEERYRLHGEPDAASELVIRSDGTFAYFLIAGALDEQR